MKAPSLRRRLVVVGVGGYALLSLAAAVASYLLLRDALTGEFDATLLLRAQSLAALVTRQDGAVVEAIEPSAFPEYRFKNGLDYFLCQLDDGQIFTQSPAAAGADRAFPRFQPGKPLLRDIIGRGGAPLREVLYRFTPLDQDRPPAGAKPRPPRRVTVAPGQLVMRVAQDRSALDRSLAGMLATLAAVGALGLAVAWWLARLAVGRVLAPLERVSTFARALCPKSLDQRLDQAGMPAELRPICEQFNGLMERLGQAFAREQRFSADVAHELRTPVAELRALSEMALTWPDSINDPAGHHRQVYDIARRMETVALNLMALYRQEQGDGDIRLEPIVLAEAITAAWAPLRGSAAGRGLSFTTGIADRCSVVSDRRMLGLAVENLLGNAVEYTPVDGAISVTFERADSGARLLIANDAPNLGAADLPNLGKRFWRKDAARTAGHSGLGLSLVAAVCERLGLVMDFALIGGRLVVSLTGRGLLASPLVVRQEQAAGSRLLEAGSR